MVTPAFQLVMRSGPNPGKTFKLEQEDMVLGRDLANEITISDPEVSRKHARFTLQGDSVVIEDLGSTNGSFLNGQRISSPQQLRVGDVITLGENIVMVFESVSYDTDRTVVSTQAEPTVQPTPPPPPPPQRPPQPVAHQQPPAEPPQQPAQPPAKKRSMPSWLLILIIAVVVLACVIAVTLWFMPASWWCALTFNTLEGCPLP